MTEAQKVSKSAAVETSPDHAQVAASAEARTKESVKIIQEIAEKEDSFVLVGRCGSYILEEKGCFSVYIYADTESRIKRAVEQYDVKENKAESIMKKADKRRETFYNVNTGRVWQDKDQYSLCLNSAELGDELCAELIVKAYQEYNSRFAE